MNIYVGNLSYRLEENELREVFEAYGEVSSVKLITDRQTGKKKGFGFVDMPNDDEAQNAIDNLHESELMSRTMIVNEAKSRK